MIKDNLLNKLTENYYFDKNEKFDMFNQISDMNIRAEILNKAVDILSDTNNIPVCTSDEYCNFKDGYKCNYGNYCYDKID